MEGKFEMECKGRMGERNEDIKSVSVLNRVVAWTPEGIEYEPDQRHAEIIIKQMGLINGSKSVLTPGIKSKYEEDDPENRELSSRERRPSTGGVVPGLTT